MSGIGILNVGAGDTKLIFDKTNPAEMMRAKRIVTDMLRRGYALLVEVGTGESKSFQRVTAFDENTCEYIIADFDSETAAKADEHEESSAETDAAATAPGRKPTGRRGGGIRRVDATVSRGVAVSRTAGG